MRITLTVVDGPNQGQLFTFDRHDTFLVGRSRHAHFKLPSKDKFASRIHFMMEVNPPECRLIDLNSHNGTFVNGQKVLTADLRDGDQIRVGHTMLGLALVKEADDVGEPFSSLDQPSPLSQVTESSTLPVALPEEIAGYQLQRSLGRGSMGITCIARRAADGQVFALKLIAPAAQGTVAQARTFLREAQQLGALQHPSIVRMHELGESKGLLYFVHDLIPGKSGGQLVAESGPLDPTRVRVWAGQLLQALEHAHSRNKIHRDIKPSNIVVNGERVLLSDYGLAYVFQKSKLSGLTMLQAGQGVFFWPPEQITNYGNLHPAGDQYSLAATLYFLLTGKFVYDFPNEVQGQFSLLLEQTPVAIRQRRADLPEDLASAIDRALSRDPAKRFPGAAAFRAALANP